MLAKKACHEHTVEETLRSLQTREKLQEATQERLRLREEEVEEQLTSLLMKKSLLEKKERDLAGKEAKFWSMEEQIKRLQARVELSENEITSLLLKKNSLLYGEDADEETTAIPRASFVPSSFDHVSFDNKDADLRLAESQFYRMMCARGSPRYLKDFKPITGALLVRIPSVISRFKERLAQLGSCPML
eukprot:4609548-Amphidinium_carterae.1